MIMGCAIVSGMLAMLQSVSMVKLTFSQSQTQTFVRRCIFEGIEQQMGKSSLPIRTFNTFALENKQTYFHYSTCHHSDI